MRRTRTSLPQKLRRSEKTSSPEPPRAIAFLTRTEIEEIAIAECEKRSGGSGLRTRRRWAAGAEETKTARAATATNLGECVFASVPKQTARSTLTWADLGHRDAAAARLGAQGQRDLDVRDVQLDSVELLVVRGQDIHPVLEKETASLELACVIRGRKGNQSERATATIHILPTGTIYIYIPAALQDGKRVGRRRLAGPIPPSPILDSEAKAGPTHGPAPAIRTAAATAAAVAQENSTRAPPRWPLSSRTLPPPVAAEAETMVASPQVLRPQRRALLRLAAVGARESPVSGMEAEENAMDGNIPSVFRPLFSSVRDRDNEYPTKWIKPEAQ